jgi:hypothetical protein
LEAANKSMGRNTIGITDAMMKHAAELQKEGIIGDEAIIQGQSFLSTFKQISDDMMPRATEAMVELMAKTGKSGQSAANMIGKAAMGMGGALEIAGVGLSDTTKAAIKAEVEMKKLAKEGGINLRGLGEDGKVFKMILTDIESQIGGTNKALGDTDSGGIDQFNNALGDMQEQIGKGVSGAISPWARQFAIDMGLINIDAEGLGVQWRNTMRNLVHASIPFLNALGGIKLAVKTLELVFGGLELISLSVFKGLASGASSVAGFFGLDTAGADEALRGLNKDFHNQLAVVKNIKKELGSIYDDVENRQFGKDLLKSFNDFDNRAKKTFEGIKNPKVTPEAFASKPTSNFSVKSGDTTGSDVRPLFPKVDRTNELLGIISNNIGRQSAVFQ